MSSLLCLQYGIKSISLVITEYMQNTNGPQNILIEICNYYINYTYFHFDLYLNIQIYSSTTFSATGTLWFDHVKYV